MSAVCDRSARLCSRSGVPHELEIGRNSRLARKGPPSGAPREVELPFDHVRLKGYQDGPE